MSRPTLLFVSPRFLFPVDSGGKIRTTQILRGMLGGHFRIRLASPGSSALAARHAADLATVCDEFLYWPEPQGGWRRTLARVAALAHPLPMPVRVDRSAAALDLVARALAERPAAAVFDFVHGAVLAPTLVGCPAVLFTHNVEAEIFARHAKVATNAVMRSLWNSQHAKMQAYEAAAVRRFEVVVAVSQRDADLFRRDYRLAESWVIPTGVDLDFFRYAPPARDRDVVFCGSMDWLANQEGVRYFMDAVWPAVTARVPDARMTVVGRTPPAALVAEAERRGLRWRFTGFVDDVRPHMSGAAVSVIPLRIGGGTRLKVYESMAMGIPVVSTAIGVEGLPVEHGRHCMIVDDPDAFAEAVVALLGDAARRTGIAESARRLVDERFGHEVAARSFEQACIRAMERAA